MKAGAAVLAAGIMVGVGACSERGGAAGDGAPGQHQTDGGEGGPQSGADPEFAQVYTTRGVVRALPDPSNPASEFQIQHEEIPEFVNGQGEVVGMRTMTMPFPTLGGGVTLDGLSVGDKIKFTFGVEWVQGTSRRYPRWTVTAIEALPVDVELELGTRPASPTEDGTPTPAATPPG